MQLRVTLLDPRRTGARAEAEITAPAGTCLGHVAERLAGLLEPDPGRRPPGSSANAQFRCGGLLLDRGTALGRPPLLQGAVLVLSDRNESDRNEAASTGPEPGGLLAAHVVAGPDAGTVVALRPGRHPIGRAATSAVRLADPDVSRHHADLVIAANGIAVHDAGSTNGTRLGERRLGAEPEPIELDQPVSLGATTIAVRGPDRPPAAAAPDGAGHLRVNRRPDLAPARARPEIAFPAAPTGRPPSRIPWPALLLPMLLAVPMALLWHQPTFLLFALMTPVLMVGQYLSDRRWNRRDDAARRVAHAQVTAAREAELATALAADGAHLEQARPDLARIAVTARTPTDDLWQHSPGAAGFGQLRLGRGAEPSAVTVRRPDPSPVAGSGGTELSVPEHADVPIAIDLPAVVVLGVCGPRPQVAGLVRALIGQAAVLHSPRHLAIEARAATPEQGADWDWMGFLPHRVAAGPDARRLVLLDGARVLRERPDLAELLAVTVGTDPTGPGPALLICTAGTEQELPVECGATVTLGPAPEPAVLRRAGAPAVRLAPDLASARWAERLARDLAPLREATPELGGSLPAAVRLVDLLAGDGIDATDPAGLAVHWRRAGPNPPTAVLGAGSSGAFRVDLRRDGPHVLIAGTTGAGKSELLQTLVAGLAVENPPDAVSFLLIDYKGGAAFRECLPLPHVGGVITDLDPHLAGRALTALAAELKRRERALLAAGASDLDGYAAARPADPALEPLPRLVVVVDEFRVLAEELPKFVGGLVRTATVGRSLGVHLVLATQRPAGVVSADIAANANLRIALRLRDAGDSRDLIDAPDAARLPADQPGRALARAGGGLLTAFQTARVTQPAAAAGSGPEIEVRRIRSGAPVTGLRAEEPAVPDVDAPSDLAMIAQAAVGAARLLNRPPVRPPWLPPLPDRVHLAEAIELAAADRTADPDRVLLGVCDRPEQQRRTACTWALDGSHLAIAGGPRSGRTTAVRTIAIASGLTGGAHVYVVDGAGALAELARLPQVEAVVAAHDGERLERLLRRLGTEIARRQATDRQREPRPGPVLLLVDGWETVLAAWSAADHDALLDSLLGVLRDGPAVGVQAAISGSRSLLTGAVSALLAERLVLRFADPTDAVLAGVDPRRISARQAPGRGVRLGPSDPDGSEVQVALAQPSAGPGAAKPGGWAVPELPSRLDYHDLLAELDQSPAPPAGAVPVGIGGEQAEVLYLPLPEGVTVVCGAPGTGRTSALATIAAGLGSPHLLVAANDREAADKAAAALDRHPDLTLLVDDVCSPADADPLGDLLSTRLGPGSAVRLVVAGTPSDLLTGYRGLALLARGARQGLLLGRLERGEGDALGVRLGRRFAGPPGRALLVRGGAPTTVQLAQPPPGEKVGR